MEKKVNLSIFFNYRNYSPRFKMLLEDTFYKKMHDEKLSSSDAMQQVMKFCNDVNEIEYNDFDFAILSRYSKADKKIMINSSRVSSLIAEHKDLDEEALLKSILEKQANAILADSIDEFSDVTFDDVLNKSGYSAPRKLSDIPQDLEENGIASFEDSAINDMLTPKIATKSEISPSLVQVTDEDKRFVSSDETVQISRVQDEIKDKLNEDKKVGFENFFPDEKVQSEDSYFQKVGVLSKRLNVDKEPEDDYSILDAVKKNDDLSEGGRFSDFVPEKKDEDYELEDDDEVTEKKNKPGIFSNMREKVSAFTDKLKNNRAKKQELENEFETKIEDSLESADSLNYTSTHDEELSSLNNKEYDDFQDNTNEIKEDYSDKTEEEAKISEDKEEFQTSKYQSDFGFQDDTPDVEINDRFDNIILAIMKEKQKEIEEDEILSTYDEVESVDSASNLLQNEKEEDIIEEKAEPNEEETVDKHRESLYDSFAEELETVESVKRRRRHR